MLAGIGCAFLLLLRLRPAVLFSKGGYVSVPVVIAARLLGIATITHESDVDAGLATRINSYLVKRVLLSYDQTRRWIPRSNRPRCIVTGNPVRQAILDGDRTIGRRLLNLTADRTTLLFLGGSRGAAQINRLLDPLLPILSNSFDIIHQCGSLNTPYPINVGPGQYVRCAFFGEQFSHVLAASDLVVCRAGAGTIWELAARRLPAILIPLRGAGTRGDQLRNAAFYCGLGAAVSIEPHNPQELLFAIEILTEMPEKCAAMSKATERLPSREAARVVADIVWKEAQRHG